MPERCIFQEVREGEMYCKIWTNKLGRDPFRGMVTKKICKSCRVPENPCRRLSVRVSILREFGSEGFINGYLATCELKKERILLPDDCENCKDYVP